MSLVINALREHARIRGDRVALREKNCAITYAELAQAIDSLAGRLKEEGSRVVGLVGDNSATWAVADLACLRAGLSTVPIPVFFSPTQLEHALSNSGVDTILAAQPEALTRITAARPGARVDVLDVSGQSLWRATLGTDGARSNELSGLSKVTYTSGTTGQPKGVKFESAALDAVVEAAVAGVSAQPRNTFIALLPLSVLVENLLGLYVALTAGAEYVVLPMAELGFRGSSRLEVSALLDGVRQQRATNMICTPQVLASMVAELERGARPLPDVEYVGVGGALIAKSVLERAARVGLPVYQAWGLSECASAVTFNRPGANRVGSVGRPLSHVQVRRADDGELLVRGRSLFAGYIGEGLRPADAWYATGDLGEIDADGYVHITGRKKTLIINSFGRNVSPEWVETQLTSRPELSQAAVFGDARPHLVGVVVPAPNVDRETLTQAIEAVNRDLPDYARLGRWLVAETPFTVSNEQLSVLGKLRRDNISRAYSRELAALYEAAP